MRLRELKINKKQLVIYDIDDTLFHTTATIKVLSKDQAGNVRVVRTLTSSQLTKDQLKPGEYYDFGEFRDAKKFRDESVPIDPMLDRMKQDIADKKTVKMLTARPDLDKQEPVAQKFAAHEIDINNDAHLYRSGNLEGPGSAAEKKQTYIRAWLSSGDYKSVTMYDDSDDNLKAFKALKQEFPQIKFTALHVSSKGTTKQVEQQIQERKRKRKKNRAAVWGPGPYGWYGYDAGYSSDGGDGGGDMEEDFPQPGESSGKAKQFKLNAKIQTKEMTLDQILNTVKDIPYVNDVINDWDAKDYSWGVTKKVIEYAQYLKKNPKSVFNLPPLVVIDGQLNDGAHRISAINLLQKKMDPENSYWKTVKLKVNFGTSADLAPEQGVSEGNDFFSGSKFKDTEGNIFSVEKIIAFAEKNLKYFHKDFPLSKIKHDLSWWQGNKERMMNADTRFPLLVIQNDDGHLSVADGLNRMKKAVDVEKKKTIGAYVVPKKDIIQFAEKQDISEGINDTKENFIEMFSKFLPLTVKLLKLKSLPKFEFRDHLEHSEQPTFGIYKNDENTLYVALTGRHPNDILRTIAHELAHYKQDTEHMLGADSGRTGSPEENQANALAGIIMRHFNKLYPKYLHSDPLTDV